MNNFYKLFIICLFMSGLSIRAQELVIGNAANLIVSPYAELVFGNGMNLVNNSTTGTFDGNITFKGPLPQSIGGDQPISLSKLSIQEGAILSLTNNVTVVQELNLANGLVFLNDNNLRLSEGATINGVFSETAMVVAEGEGVLQRELSQNGTYLFPLGDTSNVDEYSPASFEFYSTDFSNGLLSVNLKNTKHPNNTSGSDYLNRYWNVEQTGISNINCIVKFTYSNSDVVGSEASMIGSYWNGSWWSPFGELSMNEIYGEVYGFGEFTGGELDALNIEENEADDLQILVDGNRVIINAESSFPVKKIEVFNKIGQFVQVYEPANALHYEFNLNNKTDIYLLRLTSDQKIISRKIALQ